ncbi:dihydrofolate reductase [Pedobacter sp. BS3]|uniref:dihydrofolate reductase n=1 Tax=Pedobacter sp. BS3 TaxID=2567937 RepID=UPI0011EE5978|nr:dihydrofolate reductase [Pedobacter sp. BS3]TZF82560.1 dihydrofolate reductase [Pedobacter sp. BS3]
MVQLVVIADENNGIGYQNQLLCHIPADLKHFKSLTVGFPVLMGRKTFESIGKPLPGRKNIVVTHQDITIEGCDIAHSLEEAIALCKGSEKISVIGGATLYRQAIELADVVELTRIHHRFKADAWFPELDAQVWKEMHAEQHQADDKNPYPYTFITYKRKKGV